MSGGSRKRRHAPPVSPSDAWAQTVSRWRSALWEQAGEFRPHGRRRRHGHDLRLEVIDTTRTLVMVQRIVESGNALQFDESGGRITSKATGTSIPLERKGGCYVLSINLLAQVEGFSMSALAQESEGQPL